MRLRTQQRTKRLWGEAAREKAESLDWQRRYWQSHPVTWRHIMRRITGRENEQWLDFTKRRFGTRQHGLSLGCGYGITERAAIEIGFCKRWDATDVSADAVAVAEEEARKAGMAERIRYFVADANTMELPAETYDVVIAAQALHHVEALEHVLDEIAASLTPDGIFVVQEYVGPARFQMSDEAVANANRLLAVLPRHYLVDPESGIGRHRFVRPTPKQVAKVDPSEAIRSDEIVPLVEERFRIEYRADFGGTLLHLPLGGIIANFDPDDETDTALLDLLCMYEEALIDSGVIASDFTYIVATRK
jgi:SAM-dependent methyltransferase